MVDAFSRWIFVKKVKESDAKTVIQILEPLFEIFGDPKVVVTDNGPPFASERFEGYLKCKEIDVVHSPPYHPESNGLAERAVQTVKGAFRRYVAEGQSNPDGLAKRFHLEYRNSPVARGFTPSSKLLSFRPRVGLEKVFEGIRERAREISSPRDFKPGEWVWMRLPKPHGVVTRVKAQIVTRKGRNVYVVRVDQTTKLAHANQLFKRVVLTAYPNHEDKLTEETKRSPPLSPRDQNPEEKGFPPKQADVRRSKRQRRPPDRFQAKWANRVT